MPRGIANAKQLSMMDKVLSAFCSTYGVTDKRERDDAASLILQLFDTGARDEEAILAEMMKRRDTPTDGS